MALKTATPAKKATVATKPASARKAAPAKKTAAARKPATGNSLECNVCGLVVTIDEDCGCIQEHVILCCDEPMKTLKKTAPKTKK